MSVDIEAIRAQLPAVHDRIYLNTGTSGPIPIKVADEGYALMRQLVDEGFATPSVMKAYAAALRDARRAVAGVFGCSTDSVALTHSASDGMGIVASGIDWRPGDEVITSDLEHVSGVAPWVYLAQTKGVKVIHLNSRDGFLDADQIDQAISANTRLICISHVSYATGAVLPVAEVCERARAKGVWVLVDGAQSAGHLPLDVDKLGCHFYAIPGQKWLLGPEGTGALYVAPSVVESLAPSRIGWASLATDHGEHDEIKLSPGARRFETATVNAPAFRMLAAAANMMAEIGFDKVYQRARSLANRARNRLDQSGKVQIVTPSDAASGLLTVAIGEHDPEQVVKELWEKHRIVIRTIPNTNAIRASFHVFNTEEEVDRFAEALIAAL